MYKRQILTYAAVYFAFELITENDLTKINGSMYTYFAVSYTHLNSLTLPKEEVDALIAAGKQYVVRFKKEPCHQEWKSLSLLQMCIRDSTPLMTK